MYNYTKAKYKYAREEAIGMALKLKQYTDSYKGLDAEYYLSREAPYLIIISSRNVGKTTNILGEIIKKKASFMLLTRHKNEIPFAKNKLIDACKYYDTSIVWNTRKEAFVDAEGNEVGYIEALKGAQDVKNKSGRYHKVEYIVFDEFLPTDSMYIKEKTHPGYELIALKWIVDTVRKDDGGFNRTNLKVILLANLVDALNPYLCNIFDSKGTSLLTTAAKAIMGGQQNITVDDPYVFFTMHTDRTFENDDTALGNALMSFSGGTKQQFLADFRDKVKIKTPEIEKQLKTPLLATGSASMYRIVLKTAVNIGGSSLDLTKPIYYWIPSKNKPSKEEDFQRIDLDELQNWYSSIIVKAEVKDFFKIYNRQSKTGV